MAVDDSGDYELMPKKELDEIRREVTSLKKNSMSEGDKARILIESMDRLTISINRLITILDDAQKDIIEEYQQAKPAEKLNQILEQNEVIAKALVAMHGNLSQEPISQEPIPSQSYAQPQQYTASSPIPNTSPMPQSNIPFPLPGSRNIVPKQEQGPQYPRPNIADNPYSKLAPSMPPLDDFPPMDDLPPLDSPSPAAPKKRFLGMM